MRRRGFFVCAVLLVVAMTGHASGKPAPLRIGLTPTLLHERHALLARWQGYLESRLERPVSFVLRDSYADTMNLIKQGHLDIAWLSDYPYVLMKPWVRLLATPLKDGRPLYRSYLIVPRRDQSSRSLADLEGKVFAYADPYSHTGYLFPRYTLARLGKSPKTFFRRTFFTWSHRKAIEAVAMHLADGAAVESYVWDASSREEPRLTEATRIVSRSQDFGFPPLVALKALPEQTFKRVQQVMIGMRLDPEGRELLAGLHLDGFVAADPALYAEVEGMAQQMGRADDGAGF